MQEESEFSRFDCKHYSPANILDLGPQIQSWVYLQQKQQYIIWVKMKDLFGRLNTR